MECEAGRMVGAIVPIRVEMRSNFRLEGLADVGEPVAAATYRRLWSATVFSRHARMASSVGRSTNSPTRIMDTSRAADFRSGVEGVTPILPALASSRSATSRNRARHLILTISTTAS